MTFWFALLAGVAWGNGSVVSNGGSVVTCPAAVASSSAVFSGGTAVLDLFEGVLQGHTYRRLHAFRGQPFESAYPRAVALFLKRNPFLLDRAMRTFRSVRGELGQEHLPRRHAFSWSSLLYGCRLQTAALLEGPHVRGAMRLRLARGPWSSLETDQKIALLVHESLQMTALPEHGDCVTARLPLATAFVLSDRSLGVSNDGWEIESSLACSSGSDL